MIKLKKRLNNEALECSLFGTKNFGSPQFKMFLVFDIKQASLKFWDKGPDDLSLSCFTSKLCSFGNFKIFPFHKERQGYKYFAAFNADNQ